MTSNIRRSNPLPDGTIAVGVGVGATAVASYAFLVIAGRALGPTEFGGLTILWSMVFMIGGTLVPFEQEVSRRLVGLRVAGFGGRSVIVRTSILGAGLVAALCVAVAVAAPALANRLFLGEPLLVVGLCLGAVGYLIANLTEGVLSGNGRFARYGTFLAVESCLRLTICVTLVVVGVRTAGPVGLALGAAPILTAIAVLAGQGSLAAPGPEVSWRELATGLGALLAAASLSLTIMNSPPILVGFLAGPDRTAEAGVFTAALVVARVPLFVFQAVQIALLPKLSRLAASGEFDEFRSGVKRIAVVVAALVTTGTIAGFTLGPTIISVAFGDQYTIGRGTVGLLAAASGAYIMALALSVGTIALGGAKQVAIGWLLGVITMFVVAAFGTDPIARVSIAFAASTVVAAISSAWILRRVLDRGATLQTGPLLDAINDASLES